MRRRMKDGRYRCDRLPKATSGTGRTMTRSLLRTPAFFMTLCAVPMAPRYGVPSPASAVLEAFSADTSVSGTMATVARVSLPHLPLVATVTLSIALGGPQILREPPY